ncbi:serine/threonine-protein kinase [Stieleria varia]|uniref:non-specific serine/threonine protein kinase n=1 Tax=Stieleria varia TaxID=2528005 RepID=A0A5C6B1K4_9BACT|nr:serine/threonine-protein kinase [Stieleria varia]TWU05461.1 Serine/threonine-protein kinase PrkC [Stieleria varia]
MPDCPPAEILQRFVDERLSADACSRLEGHIGDCVDCQSKLDHLCASVLPAVHVMIDPQHLPIPDRAWSPARAERLAAAVRKANSPHPPTHSSEVPLLSSVDTDDGGTYGEETTGGDSQQLPETIDPGEDDSPNSEISYAEKARVSSPIRKIDDYEIVSEIARGGMGIVYKAWDVKLKCFLALKTIVSGELASERNLYRFQREAEATAKLRHPNIVRIHRVGECNGLHYFTMDFIAGPTLQHLAKQQSLSEADAVRLTIEICDAIAYAHKNGVLHRDLKPSNVLTDETGRAMVTDFGLAKCLEDDSDFSQTGQAIGTPSYMPPEQAAGRKDEIGFQSDVYSIGALLFHLLTGRAPFVGETHHAIIHQVLESETVSPRKLNPKVSRSLEIICVKCLQKECSRRYTTALELKQDLERFQLGYPILARRASPFERLQSWCRRNRAIAAMIVITLLTFGIGIAMTRHRSRMVTENMMARVDSAWDRLNAQMQSVDLTHQSSHDELVPRRVGMDADQLQAALDGYDDAIAAWQTFNGTSVLSEQRRFDIAEASYRVAKASRLLGDFPRSEHAFQTAIDRLQKLSQQVPANPQYATLLGEAYDYLGELYRDHGHRQQAESAYQKSLSLLKDAQAKFPENPATSQELARVENNHGLLLESEGKLDAAARRYAQSEKILRQQNLRDSENIESQIDLARTLINLGRMERIRHRYEDAENAYREAIDELQGLFDLEPDNRRIEFLLAVTQRNLGYMFSEQLNDPVKAQRWLVLALDHFNDLPTSVPEYQFNKIICLVNLTSLHGLSGDEAGLEKCRSFYKSSLEAMNRLITEFPGIAEYESWMGLIQGNGSAIAAMEKQTSLAKDRITEAIKHQQQAVELQPNNLDYQQRLASHRQFQSTLSTGQSSD